MTAQQRLKLVEDTLLSKKQVENLTADITLSIAQQEKVAVDTSVSNKQGLKLTADTSYVLAQETLVAEELALITKQRDKLTADIALSDIQIDKLNSDIGLATSQITKIIADTAISGQQLQNLSQEKLKTIAETTLISQNADNALSSNDLIAKQGAKSDAEKALLAQKTLTEEAQIKDNVGENDTLVTGSIGRQKDVYKKQADGFDRNAEIKLAKIYADMFTVQRSTDEAFVTAGSGLEYINSQKVMKAAFDGINAGVFVEVPEPVDPTDP